jgi:hypothetical protein
MTDLGPLSLEVTMVDRSTVVPNRTLQLLLPALPPRPVPPSSFDGPLVNRRNSTALAMGFAKA